MQTKVQLLWDKAPETCRLVAELASRSEEAGSRFYRNEAVPEVRPCRVQCNVFVRATRDFFLHLLASSNYGVPTEDGACVR